MQLGQRGARLDAEFVDEDRAGRAVGVERVRLAAGAVERRHQEATRPFAERMLEDELLQLAHHVGVSPERQVGLDPPLEREHSELLEAPCNGVEQRLLREVGERATAPEGEARREGRGGHSGIAVLERAASLVRELLEALQVERPGLHREHVPSAARLDRLLSQGLAEPGDVSLDEVRRRARGVVAPEPVDDSRRGHEGIRPTEEQCERGALLRRAEAYRAPVDVCLQRPEHAVLDVHRPTLLR